ncbi:hypothetical protein BKA93DRAFT_820299 [Sparassis latifolia]
MLEMVVGKKDELAADVRTTRAASPPNILERPISPAVTSFSPIIPSSASSTPSKPRQHNFVSCSPSPSPPNLGRRTSLIDLKEWVVDDGPSTHTNGATASSSLILTSNSKMPSPPLINLDPSSPPKSRTLSVPPLPPRKSSYSSLKSVSPTSSTSSLGRSPATLTIPLPLAVRPPSTRMPPGTHTYPPASTLGIAIPLRGHAPASSISSFHSVSLSSDGEPAHRESDAQSIDIDDFETVSATSASPSVARGHDWEQPVQRVPPKLPQRPPSASTTTLKPPPKHPPPSRSSTSPSFTSKPPPPAPPPPLRSRAPSAPSVRSSPSTSTSTSFSDRSSIRSTSTVASSQSHTQAPARGQKLARQTPVPPAARRRYEALFTANVRARRPRIRSPPPGTARKRQAAGWRGLSVDLITSPELGEVPLSEKEEEPAEVDERLEGATVRRIWSLSRLERGTLRAIWNECDPGGTGALDRAAFVRGMWRIDEELRHAQFLGLGRQVSSIPDRFDISLFLV